MNPCKVCSGAAELQLRAVGYDGAQAEGAIVVCACGAHSEVKYGAGKESAAIEDWNIENPAAPEGE